MPSNLAATLTQNLRSEYNRRLDKNENRPSIYGGVNLFKSQTADPGGIFTEEVLNNIANSFGNTVEIPVIQNEDVVIGNTRTCNFQTGGVTSQLVQLVFITYSFGFEMYPAQHYNNDAAYEAVFNRLLQNRLLALASVIDAQCIATLEANKNQFYPADLLAYYAQVGDALQVPQAEKEDLYNQVGSITQTMDYMMTPDFAVNHPAMALVRRLAAQGDGNAVNEGFQLLGYTWYPTNRVQNNAGVEQTLYGVIPGNVAMVPRVDPDSRQGNSIGTQKEWSEVVVPILDIPMGVFYQEDCSDATAIDTGVNNLTRTKRESFEYSVDVCYQVAYNSDNVGRYSPIQKFEVLQ